jgi:ferritin-like metal-binding protein YciE
MKLLSLHDLMIEQMRDLLDAENRIVKVLPKMAKAASNEELAEAFKGHHAETLMHVKRLEQAFKHLKVSPKRKTCEGIKGLLKEGEEFLEAKAKKEMDPDVRDAGLIASAQRVEHYEMAGYGTALAFAKRMRHREVAELLEQTLREETATDKKLTAIAESEVNEAANDMVERRDEREPAYAL